MKVIEFLKYGEPEVLHLAEREKPIPGKGELRIKIHATAVNSGDWRVRKADPFLVRLFFGICSPKKSARVLGSVFSGVVDAVGDTVTRFKVGDRVWGMSDLTLGCYAEYITLPENSAIANGSEQFAHEDLAGTPFGLHTAYHFLKTVPKKTNMKMLVVGASGSVGSSAIQLGKISGMNITALTRQENFEFVKEIGADTAIDHSILDSNTAKEKYDLVFVTSDKVDLKKLKKFTAENSIIILVSAGIKDSLLAGIRSRIWKRKIVTGLAKVTSQDMEYFHSILVSGEFKPTIQKVYPMEEIVEAHRFAESYEKKGNIAVQMVT